MEKLKDIPDSTKKTSMKEHSDAPISNILQKKMDQMAQTNIREAMIPERYKFKTFDDFELAKDRDVFEKQSFVKKACLDIAAGLNRTGLIMCGKNGTGKTLLCSIILQAVIRSNPEIEAAYFGLKSPKRLFTEAIKMVRMIKSSWTKGSTYSEQQAIEYFTKPTLLVIDELGVQYGSPVEAQFITEIINDRYNQNKPTILSGNLTINEIRDLIGDRVIDRFREGGKVLVFDWDSYRGK